MKSRAIEVSNNADVQDVETKARQLKLKLKSKTRMKKKTKSRFEQARLKTAARMTEEAEEASKYLLQMEANAKYQKEKPKV